MAIVNNQTFPFSKWWFSSAIELVNLDASCFSKKNTSKTMAYLIAGSNVVSAIKEWLLAADIISSGTRSTFNLSHFGETIAKYDKQLNNSGTWWAIHLALAFSPKAESYSLYFSELSKSSGFSSTPKNLLKRIQNRLDDQHYAEASIEKSFEGVNKLFDKNLPLAELGLIKKYDDGKTITLGKPEITYDIVLHALIKAKFLYFASRETFSFSQLHEVSSIHDFLCISVQELRDLLLDMAQSTEYSNYFSFNTAIDIESLTVNSELTPQISALKLIQSKSATWK